MDNFLLRADVRYRLDTLAGDLGNSYFPPFASSGVNSQNSVFNDLLVNVGFMIPSGNQC